MATASSELNMAGLNNKNSHTRVCYAGLISACLIIFPISTSAQEDCNCNSIHLQSYSELNKSWEDWKNYQSLGSLPPHVPYQPTSDGDISAASNDAIYRYASIRDWELSKRRARYAPYLNETHKRISSNTKSTVNNVVEYRQNLNDFKDFMEDMTGLPNLAEVLVGEATSSIVDTFSDAQQAHALKSLDAQNLNDLENFLDRVNFDGIADDLNNFNDVLGEAISSPQFEAPSEEGDSEEKQKSNQFIEDITAGRDPASIKEDYEKDYYGEKTTLKEDLLDGLETYVNANAEYAVYAEQGILIAEGLGLEVPEEIKFASSLYSSSIDIASQAATGNYLGAAISTISLISGFNKKQPPSPEQMILEKLARIDQKLDEIIDNQKKILENQEKILENIAELAEKVDANTRLLASQIRYQSDLIRKIIITAEWDENINACSRFTNRIYNPANTELSPIEKIAAIITGGGNDGLSEFRNCDIALTRLFLNSEHETGLLHPYFDLRQTESLAVLYGADAPIDHESRTNQTPIPLLEPEEKAELLLEFSYSRDVYKGLLEYWEGGINRHYRDSLSTLDGAYYAPIGMAGFADELSSDEKISSFLTYRQEGLITLRTDEMSLILRTPINISQLIKASSPLLDMHYFYGTVAAGPTGEGLNFVPPAELENGELDLDANKTLTKRGINILDDAILLANIAKAQNAIIDGQAIAPLMIEDIFGVRDAESSEQAAYTERALELAEKQGSVFKTNLSQTLIDRLLSATDTPWRRLGLVISTARPYEVELMLNELLAKTFPNTSAELKLSCSRADATEPSKCRASTSRTDTTNMQFTIYFQNGDDSYQLSDLPIPSLAMLETKVLESNIWGLQSVQLLSALTKERASYYVPEGNTARILGLNAMSQGLVQMNLVE